MTDAYDRTFNRTKAVLTDHYRDALGAKGIEALYDAVMIMAFADGDVCEEETRFLNDFSEFIDCKGSDDDLTPESLLERLGELSVEPMAAEAFVKVLLIVTDLDDDVGEDEMQLWRDVGRTLGITTDRMKAIRALLNRAKAGTQRFKREG